MGPNQSENWSINQFLNQFVGIEWTNTYSTNSVMYSRTIRRTFAWEVSGIMGNNWGPLNPLEYHSTSGGLKGTSEIPGTLQNIEGFKGGPNEVPIEMVKIHNKNLRRKNSLYFHEYFQFSLHTEKSFLNLIKSNWNPIVFTMQRLIWNQTDVVWFQMNRSALCTSWP